MALLITITDAGRAEIINADNTGTGPVVITEIGIGAGQYAPSKAQSALTAEIKRITSIAGQAVAADTIHVMIKDEGADAYNVGEFGLYSASGTLVAVYSQVAAAGWIIQKAGAATLLLAVDIILESLDAASLVFGDITFLNPPATTETPGVVQLENTLISASTSKALTAAQGKKLQDEKEPAFAAGTTAQYRRGDKTWRDFATDVRASILTGLNTATSTVVVATDAVLTAIGKLQAQITGLSNSKLDKLANAVSATKLATARAINGVAFDGSADITVADATKLPLTGGRVSGNLTIDTGIDGGYGNGNGGSNAWGACIWGIGPSYDGVGVNDTFAPTSMYGMAWIRGLHASHDTQVGEGIYVYQGGVLKGGMGSAGIKTAGIFYGNGSGITSLNATNISAGTLAVARGGTGATSTTGSGSNVLSDSPALTGVPTAPTAAAGTSTTQLASTAFVVNQFFSSLRSLSCFHAVPSAAQPISAGVVTRVNFATEVFDTANNYTPASSRFTVPTDGYYEFDAAVHFTGNGGPEDNGGVELYVNGAIARRIAESYGPRNQLSGSSGPIWLAAGSYVQIYAWTDVAATINTFGFLTYFNGKRIS